MNDKIKPVMLLSIIAAIVAVGSLLFRVMFIHAPLDRDEGEFAYAGWRMIHGGVPFLDYYNMKMPGIYGAFALLFLVFGSTVEAVRWGLIIVNLCNTYFVYRIGNQLRGKETGIVSAICYLIFSLQVELQGTCSHAEHFAMALVLPGLLLLFMARERKLMKLFFASGILFGLGFLMKQPAIAFVFLAGLYILIDALRSGNDWKHFLKAFSALALGSVMPILITAILLAMAGAGHNFKWFAFDYARAYISYIPVADGWNSCVNTLSKAVKPNLLLWLLLPVSCSMLIFRKGRRKRMELFLFLVFSLLAVSAGFYFRPHYFQFLLPAAAVSAAFAFPASSGEANKWMPGLVVVYLAAGIFYFVWNERELFAIRDDDAYVKRLYGLDFFNATKKAAAFIASGTNENDRVAIFGAEPEMWFYSKRIAASGYLYVYPLLENHRYAPEMRQQFYDEIEKSHPDILVYTSNEGTWYASREASKEIYAWYLNYRGENFKRIALIDMPWEGETVYHLNPDTTVKPVNPENYIEVYQRKVK